MYSMAQLRNTLLFGGKRYRIDRWFLTKSEADEYADYVRSRGALARVVTEHDGYSVFIRGRIKAEPEKKPRFRTVKRKGFKQVFRRNK